MMDDRKQQRIEEVKALLAAFADQHLVNAPDLVGYIHRLWEQIGRKRTYVITGGTKEVWASAVVYAGNTGRCNIINLILFSGFRPLRAWGRDGAPL